ncbi:MAG: regulatory protein [Solirubrobacteraceae bacterium]|nr:regulatory protein [Solirubrobacteraceae bacterium]
MTLLARQRASDPQAQLQDALDLSFSYLGHRDRTVAEVRRHLERKRVEPVGIDAAIAELEHLGYLDDARFARRFAEDRRRLDGWGTDRIERRLRALGVDPAVAATALAGDEAHDELVAAVALLRRRFAQPPADDRERERALGMLARRGYELELAYDAVRAFERGD